MGRFSFEYMARNFITGFTDTLGATWWANMGDLSNYPGSTYPGAIPMSAVRQFFSWEPVKATVMREGDSIEVTETEITEEGVTKTTIGPFREAIPVSDWEGKQMVMITHSETGDLLGIHSEGYPNTGYTERLVEGLESILDDSLEAKVGSMGILDGGKQAWIQIRSPEVVHHSTGEQFYPWIAAYSSLDGSLANTFKEGTTRIQCDNTFTSFRGEDGKLYKYKNTSQNALDVLTARSVLDLLEVTAAREVALIDSMVASPVTAEQYDKVLEIIIPMPENEGRGKTMATNKRNGISEIYYHSPMAAPFTGTKWGVLQAFTTFDQHSMGEEDTSADRFVKNAKRLVRGAQATHDQKVLAALASV